MQSHSFKKILRHMPPDAAAAASRRDRCSLLGLLFAVQMSGLGAVVPHAGGWARAGLAPRDAFSSADAAIDSCVALATSTGYGLQKAPSRRAVVLCGNHTPAPPELSVGRRDAKARAGAGSAGRYAHPRLTGHAPARHARPCAALLPTARVPDQRLCIVYAGWRAGGPT